ncbi:MAG: RagB/SusD family nutrient uptake outer membrane protein [Muribaculaceae bacterium]|nr:RagB/SusD family nutrient uptake outer membrane protein [Muribaculaceae bacterium]
MKKLIYLAASMLLVGLTGCNDFLDAQKPQGTLDDTQVLNPKYVDNLVISAYAGLISIEDINSSFSMWNYDVRSDDAYKGGNGTEDGDVFNALEISQGIRTTDWNISSMWDRLYQLISRANAALSVLEDMDSSTFPLREQRIAEMRFVRAYGHFLLKRLYKNIPFAIDAKMSPEEYNNLENTRYTNDEGWQLIIDDFKFAFDTLPAIQDEVGRPNRAAAAAFLAKIYSYKAYRQDDPQSNQVTEINHDDLMNVVKYSDSSIMAASGCALDPDFHNNFRPEPIFENGPESIWAMQYSFNDGTNHGNCNWSYGLIVPNIPGVTDGGCDFYKPTQNLVNAFKTDENGLPYLDTFNNKDYSLTSDSADPRLFLTVGMPGTPYMFNKNFIMDKSATWSRSNGLYGYYVTLKQNVDPESEFLVKGGGWWGSPMNRIALRYADILLLRAEALVQLNQNVSEAIEIVNTLRMRARQSVGIISDYPQLYGARINIASYSGSYGQADALKIVKFERRLELAMECERFFDLVRWGEADQVLNKYYADEADNCSIYATANFTPNKNEYLPIPFSQLSASDGHYKQNIGNW